MKTKEKPTGKPVELTENELGEVIGGITIPVSEDFVVKSRDGSALTGFRLVPPKDVPAPGGLVGNVPSDYEVKGYNVGSQPIDTSNVGGLVNNK